MSYQTNYTIGQICCHEAQVLMEKLSLLTQDYFKRGTSSATAFIRRFHTQGKEVPAWPTKWRSAIFLLCYFSTARAKRSSYLYRVIYF